MRAIAVGDDVGIGIAATVGTRDNVATNTYSSFKKRVDMLLSMRVGGWCHRAVVFVVWSNQGIVNVEAFEHPFSTTSK